MDLQIEYRPKTVREFVGQDSVVKAIVSDYQSGHLKHTMMFVGPSGVGKTTLAYIIANQILRSHPSVIREINAANARGIDEVREWTRDIGTRPLVGANKVFIVDEAHQLTPEAMNALLKPLEDPRNSHVYWIFCTTNPSKIIPTIKTRCTTYNFDTLSNEDMVKVLRPIVEKEVIHLPEEVLKIIIKKANGVPREAVKLLDQLRNLNSQEDINKVLSEFKVEASEYENLVKFLKKDWAEIGPKMKELLKKKTPEAIRIGLMYYYSVVLSNARTRQEQEMAYILLETVSKPLEFPQEPACVLMLWRINNYYFAARNQN